MPFLTEDEIKLLSDHSLLEAKIIIARDGSTNSYVLKELPKHGSKGVVWKGKELDTNRDVAIKFIPWREYEHANLLDEVTKAQNLNPDYFAEIVYFGEVMEPLTLKDQKFYAVVTKWVTGMPLKEFIETDLLTVDQFLILARNFFESLAILKSAGLCHDDLHANNIMIEKYTNQLYGETVLRIKIIDTGTIKSIATRDKLLGKLKENIEWLEKDDPTSKLLPTLKKRLDWKRLSDHERIIECLLLAANGLLRLYHNLEYWERRFLDDIIEIFKLTTEEDLERRIQIPKDVMSLLYSMENASKRADHPEERFLKTPFDYPSSEMIRDDKEFFALFSQECPWLEQCKSIQPLYIYGPRGSGKSSVLRYLSFKTYLEAKGQSDFDNLKEVGIYMSCSVELRSRFSLLKEESIDKLETPIIKYFNCLLLEELFDTLKKMELLEKQYSFGFTRDKLSEFTKWTLKRLNLSIDQFKLEGQGYFDYLKVVIRKMKWDTWSDIQNERGFAGNSDPSLISDISREIINTFDYFNHRVITFLIDDYSNQRIPVYLQRKLNKTISFAKIGIPLFKVTSEYNGVDLEGIDRSREVSEINIGEKYTSLEETGIGFIQDIMDRRLDKTNPKYESKIVDILGRTKYRAGEMADAIYYEKSKDGEKFYYHGLDCIHWICSGDVALALELIHKIFDNGNVRTNTQSTVTIQIQHNTIQEFAHEELKRLKYIFPFGDKIYEIMSRLVMLSHTIAKTNLIDKKDRKPTALCKTHIDIKYDAILKLEQDYPRESELFSLMIKKAILFSLSNSRTKREGQTERFQIRRIYLPAFKAPLKRDRPITIDTIDHLKSLLMEPDTFAKREANNMGVLEFDFNKLKEEFNLEIESEK